MLIFSSKAFLSFCAKRSIYTRLTPNIRHQSRQKYYTLFSYISSRGFSTVEVEPVFKQQKYYTAFFNSVSVLLNFFMIWASNVSILRMTIMLRDVFVSYICVYVLSYAYLCYIYVIYFSFSSSFSFDLVKIGTLFFAYILEDVLLFLVVYVNEECE